MLDGGRCWRSNVTPTHCFPSSISQTFDLPAAVCQLERWSADPRCPAPCGTCVTPRIFISASRDTGLLVLLSPSYGVFKGEVKVIRVQTGANQHLQRPWFSFPVPCKHGKELLLNPWRCLLTFVESWCTQLKAFLHTRTGMTVYYLYGPLEATLALRSRSKRFLLILFVEISAEVEVPKPRKQVISGDPNLLSPTGMTWTEVFMSEASRSALFLPSRSDYKFITQQPTAAHERTRSFKWLRHACVVWENCSRKTHWSALSFAKPSLS